MANTVKKGWRDVTINEYYALRERLDDETLNEYDKAAIRVAFASGMDEDDVWNLSISEFNRLQVESLWLDDFKIREDATFSTITIDGEKYKVDTNLQHFTVAQYIDFQTFYPKRREGKYLGNILACLLIPDGKKYADGYDINAVAQRINESLDIMTANELMFFFLKKYLISIRVTANYLNLQMKRMKRRLEREQYERLTNEWAEAKRLILDGLRSSIALAN